MKEENKHIYLYIGLTIAVIFIALTPYIFAKGYSGVIFNADTGAIGDTIGGITAPFINLLAAFLVWISFREQVKANKLLSTETSYNFIKSLIKDFKTTTSETRLKTKNNHHTNTFSLDRRPYNTIMSGNRYIDPQQTDRTDKLPPSILQSFNNLTNDIISLTKIADTVTSNIKKSNLDNSIKNNLMHLIKNEIDFIKQLKNKYGDLYDFITSYNQNFNKDLKLVYIQETIEHLNLTIIFYATTRIKYVK